MNRSAWLWSLSILILCRGLAVGAGATDGQIAVAKARFTVLTPYCIRLEWGEPVDQPTLFVPDRSIRYKDSRIVQDNKALTIDTGKMKLTYTGGGRRFTGDNLKVVFERAGRTVVWSPDSPSTGNLGGPVATLDGWGGAKPTPDGLLSRDGWCLIDDTAAPLLQGRNAIVQRPGGWRPKTGLVERQIQFSRDVDWYLFAYGTDYKAALRSLVAVSGKVPMPRRHVLGSWYCRWYDYTSDDFRRIVKEYGEHDFPIDIMVMDMGWHGQAEARTGYGHGGRLGWTGYTWNKTLIPDAGALLKEFHDDGISVTLNDHPCDGMRSHEEYYPEFMKLLPPGTPENPPFDAGNPGYMDAFFKTALEPREKQGVDFWWVDWQQDYIYPYVHGVPGLQHLPWLNYLYFQHSGAGDKRGQGFSRWGGWGDHRHPIHFSGDTRATWDMLAFQIAFTAFSGNSGCFFWAHDLGGFAGERNPEMFTRWIQFGAFSPALRVHSCGSKLDRRPWLWGERFERSMRAAYHLRSQLMPYIYSSVRQCHEQALPLLRPMYLEYPLEEEAYRNPQQYFFGDAFIVAPVARPGRGDDMVAEQKIWVPKGDWYQFLTGERMADGKIHAVTANIDQIPVIVRGGVPIPMQSYTPRMTTAPLTNVVVRCFPGVSGESVLYEDDGESKGYLHHEWAATRMVYSSASGAATLSIDPVKGRYQGQPLSRSYQVEFAAIPRPARILVNGEEAPVEYRESTATAVVRVPRMDIADKVDITLGWNHSRQ